MLRPLTRRRFIEGAAAATVVTTLPGCSNPDEQSGSRPGEVPVGPFGADSTTMDVVEGLDLSGKTAFITGCNSGLGYETARVLSLQGATIIGAARTLEKAENACASFAGEAIPVVCELSELESVAACGKSVQKIGIPVDMLILNAGIMGLPELEQINGIERQFFVNHIGHFALTSYIVDQVVAAPQGRVVVVSSSGHSFAPEAGIEFDNLSGERDYEPWKMYGVSKLANGLFSLELTKRLANTNATSNAIHPGIINTNLGRHFPWWQRVAGDLIGWTFMKSIEEGAATQTYVATAPALAGYSGYYFADCNPIMPDPRMLDEAQAAELWRISEQITEGYLAA
ncbi:MAG: SDR family NAD(P)-dependent oxidoreductase [Gammaproteobacteria bacterium]|nr:SDR family NAD(P)-dependent oxidoreductase [Gammaproteobacteria bacterium]MDP6616108.1 SDR family NAD(P)-dependent oxidoreductase [Gammaproteobacteria bacterium]MDP6694874.1 SDR family NAD(P)-dependent oxidoreductase [Gammaproteobacteria bacterium]